MKILFLILIYSYSFSAFAYRLSFDHNKLNFNKMKGGKDNISIQNNLSESVLVQLWSEGRPVKSIRVDSKKERNIKLLSGKNYSILGISPPTRKFQLN